MMQTRKTATGRPGGDSFPSLDARKVAEWPRAKPTGHHRAGRTAPTGYDAAAALAAELSIDIPDFAESLYNSTTDADADIGALVRGRMVA